MYFPDRGCVHTLLTLYVYDTGYSCVFDLLVVLSVASFCCNSLCKRQSARVAEYIVRHVTGPDILAARLPSVRKRETVRL